MDRPEGPVCRVAKLSVPFDYPTSPESVSNHLKAIIQAVWYAKQTIEKTLSTMESSSDCGSLSFIK